VHARERAQRRRIRRGLDHAAGAGSRAELEERAVEQLLAARDQHDAIAQALGVLHDVRREDDRRPVLAEIADDLLEHLLVDRIEAGERLVEDDELRPVRDRGEHLHLLLPCPSTAPRSGVLELAQAVALEQLDRALLRVLALEPLQHREVGDDLARRHLLVEALLLGQVADASRTSSADGWPRSDTEPVVGS
jgi:hypothetical protein